MDVAIIGAGLVGRLCTLELLKRGAQITLFDQDSADGEDAAGMTAAGMLALFAELESAESIIFEKGERSIALWPAILEELGIGDAYMQRGTVITAHPQDYSELDHFIQSLQAKVPQAKEIQPLDARGIAEYEPDLGHHQKGFYIPQEGVVDAQRFMEASYRYLSNNPAIKWHEKISVRDEELAKYQKDYDLVIDSRGTGAKDSLSQLRGVRGEVLWLESDEIAFTRPVRMLHPRYRLYIVPRPEHRYIIGATEIESDDKSPLSVRSGLELLSALYSLHPSFGEARVLKCVTNTRPALTDNLPLIQKEGNLLTINGLYRHGYLMGPSIVEEALKEIK